MMVKANRLKKITEITFLTLLVFLVTLPFINKPYHVDDTIFLYYANYMQEKSLDPYSQEFRLVGLTNEGINFIDPPLVPGYYAMIMSVFGKSEWILHISYLPFILLGAYSIYFLSRRFVKNYYLCTLIILVTPAFLVMYHNLMLDIPVISFIIFSLVLFIYGVDKEKKYLIFLSSIIAAITPLIKYTGAIIIPIMGLYLLVQKKYRYLYFIAMPVISVLSWEFIIYNSYGHGPFLFSAADVSGKWGSMLNFVAVRLLTSLIYIGNISIFTIFFLKYFLRDTTSKYLFLLIGLFSLPLIFIIKKVSANFFSGPYGYIEIIFIVMFFVIGLFYIFVNGIEVIKIFKKTDKTQEYDRDCIFLYIWFFLALIGNIFFAGGGVRHFTLSLVPLTILIFLNLQNRIHFSKIRSRVFFAFIATLILSLGISYADYQYASVYRDFSKKIAQMNLSNSDIYFFGDFGFSSYMEDEGYNYTIIKDIPQYINNSKKEDKTLVIVKPQILFPRNINNMYFNNSLELISKSEYVTKFPLRVHSYKAHAGFYTFSAGLLPYTFSSEPLEIFYIYRLNPKKVI